MVTLLFYIIEVWLELTIFLIGGTVLFLYSMARAKRPLALHLFRTPFVRHYLIDRGGFSSHIHTIKEMKLRSGAIYIDKCGTGSYIYESGALFQAGKERAIAHAIGKSPPLKYVAEEGWFELANGEKYASDVKVGFASKIFEDLNRSSYGKKDLLTLIMFFGILGMQVIAIYLIYETWQETQLLANYMAHYFTGTSTTSILDKIFH